MPEQKYLLDGFLHLPRIAYFSMEIALRNEIPTYSGGLGILAGDTLRSSADLKLPMVGVTLVSRMGYFRQEIDARGRQVEQPDPWDPTQWASPLKAAIAVSIEGRDVWVKGWLYVVECPLGGRVPVILLDTDLDVNQPEDRIITHFLYGGDPSYRLKQEIVLGLGGLLLLQALGFDIRHYHMNEGHSALLTLGLMQRFAYPSADVRADESPYDLPRVRELCTFTTHTPVEAGHDQFPYELVERTLGGIVALPILKQLAGQAALNLTLLAMNASNYINGVAKRHAEVSRQMFPGYQVHAVTNGVHPFTWTSPGFAQLYDAYLPGWAHEPELFREADQIPDQAVWEAHVQAKQHLIERVAAMTSTHLDQQLPILGFARRMTAYKRADLLFSDLDRLRVIARQYPFQIVLGGKAHPQDGEGKRLIQLLHGHIASLKDVIPMVYLPNYDMALAAAMVAGTDLWLNTPLPPLEASGTSGMKAAFNGVPQLSVLDGWWIEGCIDGITGWAIGQPGLPPDHDADALYARLEQTILPLYAENRSGWIAVMKGAISKNAAFFNSHRMMRRYVTEAYLD